MEKKLWYLAVFLFISLVTPISGTSLDLQDTRFWTFSPGTQEQSPQDAKDLRFLPLHQFQALETLVPAGTGFLWLRARFNLPEQLQGKDLDLLLGRIRIASQVYFNGVKLGQDGGDPPKTFSEWNRFRYYPFINGLLKGENELLVKIFVDKEGAIDGVMLLGEHAEVLREYSFQDFFTSVLNGISSAFLLLIGIYHLFIFIKRPNEKFTLYYALLAFTFSVYQMNFYITRIPNFLPWDVSFFDFQKVIFIAMYASLFLLFWFLKEFLRSTFPKWARYAMKGILLVTVTFFTLAPDFSFLNTCREYLRPVIYLPMMLSFYLLIRGIASGNHDAKILTLGLIPVLLAIVYDTLIIEVLKIPGIYLSGFGASTFIISLFFIIANRFANFASQVENINVTLEQRVQERTSLLQEANRQLESLAVTDGLTEVLNRRAFNLRFEPEFRRAQRDGSPLGILLIDIDHFKNINDTHGHPCGDSCLKEVARVLKENIRRPGDFLARYGGEEFIVLLPETPLEGVLLVAEKMRQGVENLSILFEEKTVKLTISLGAGVSDLSGCPDHEALLALVDEKLYQAKHQGRNRVVS